jgi:hypothetical protein
MPPAARGGQAAAIQADAVKSAAVTVGGEAGAARE